MKKLLFLFLISNFGFGQTNLANQAPPKQYLPEEKFISKSEFVANKSFDLTKTILLENGVNEKVNVKFQIYDLDNDILKSDFKMFNQAILLANNEAMSTLKTQSTYKPLYIQISKSKSKWLLKIEFSGQNEYGGTKDATLLKYINNDGSLNNVL